MTNPDLTLIAILVDRSGSMLRTKSDAEGGLKAFLAEQKKAPGETIVTLAQFDTEFDTVHAEVPIKDVKAYKLIPRGMTALHDAIGKLTTEVGERLAARPEEDRPGKVYLVIVTDGLENSSKEWTAEGIKDLIQRQENQWGWQVVYIGANQDAILVGEQIGVPSHSSITYDPRKTGSTYSVASAAITTSRTTGESVAFTDSQRSSVAPEEHKS